MMRSEDFIPETLSGRNRRLLHEWRTLERRFGGLEGVDVQVAACNAAGLPVGIESVPVVDSIDESQAVYNLSGQRVGKDFKGLAIKGGKKVFLK